MSDTDMTTTQGFGWANPSWRYATECTEVPDATYTTVLAALEVLAEQLRAISAEERDGAYKLIESLGALFGLDGGFGPTITGLVSASGQSQKGPTGEQWGAP